MASTTQAVQIKSTVIESVKNSGVSQAIAEKRVCGAFDREYFTAISNNEEAVANNIALRKIMEEFGCSESKLNSDLRAALRD